VSRGDVSLFERKYSAIMNGASHLWQVLRGEDRLGALWGSAIRRASMTKEKLPEFDPTGFSVPPGFNERVEDVLQTSKDEIETADWVLVDLDGGSMEAGYALASGKKLITFGRAPSPLSFMCVEYAPAAADWQGALHTLMHKTRPRIGRSLNIS
jgi:hypothetical protein